MSRWYPVSAITVLFGTFYFWLTGHFPALQIILVFIGIATASHLAVSRIRSLALERMLDVPNERSSHISPTPRGGGMPIVMLALPALVIAMVRSGTFDTRTVAMLAMTLAGIALLGFLDDIRSLGAPVRLLTHVIAAIVVTAAIGPIDAITFATGTSLNLNSLAFPLTVTWIVGLTNAYNFMDGIDGIAGSQALIAALAWTIVGALSANTFLVIIGITLAGGSAGFLSQNWPPARIFMGDVASGFLGFTFAILTVVAAQAEPRAVIAGVLFVWPFVFDTLFTFARRLYRRENVLHAHRSHLYQRLVIAGASHKTVTTIYAILSCICSLVGILIYCGRLEESAAPLVAAAGTAGTIYFMTRRAEKRKEPGLMESRRTA
jgi:UDP-N-acetylmuramyl pentapeptide phosphotransferase/UDP-N-acetylglucosamine-1-phosphate transferase